MAKDLNGIGIQFFIEAIKSDPILQVSVVVVIMLCFVLASTTTTTSPASTPVTAQGGPPPVAPPGPPSPVSAPTPPAPSVAAPAVPVAPLFAAPAPKDVKPGQSLDDLAQPAKKPDDSFGRVREQNTKSSVEVKK